MVKLQLCVPAIGEQGALPEPLARGAGMQPIGCFGIVDRKGAAVHQQEGDGRDESSSARFR